MIDVYRILVGKSEERCRVGGLGIGGSIKMDLKDIEPDGVGWIKMAQVRVQWRSCKDHRELRVPSRIHNLRILP
jgi:hypothetical protein